MSSQRKLSKKMLTKDATNKSLNKITNNFFPCEKKVEKSLRKTASVLFKNKAILLISKGDKDPIINKSPR